MDKSIDERIDAVIEKQEALLNKLRLKPCPFCGGTNTVIDEKNYWTGMRSVVSHVVLRHWCEKSGDEFIEPRIDIRARNSQDATERWNART